MPRVWGEQPVNIRWSGADPLTLVGTLVACRARACPRRALRRAALTAMPVACLCLCIASFFREFHVGGRAFTSTNVSKSSFVLTW